MIAFTPFTWHIYLTAYDLMIHTKDITNLTHFNRCSHQTTPGGLIHIHNAVLRVLSLILPHDAVLRVLVTYTLL